MRFSTLAALFALIAFSPTAMASWTTLDVAMERASFEVAAAVADDPSGTFEPFGTVGMSDAEKRYHRLNELYEWGRHLYEAGRLAEARGVFEEMLLLDPEEYRARTYLENTREEWERHMAEQRALWSEEEKEQQGRQMLRTPVTIETKLATPLSEFLGTLSFASGMDFHVPHGIEAGIEAKFVDIPLADVLDAVLLPIGLNWTQSRGVVTIEQALITRTFPLDAETLAKVKALYDANILQTMLWGQEGRPQLRGEDLFIDERSSILVATDSEARLTKLAGLLRNLDSAITPDLVTRFYKVSPRDGQKIKALIDAVIRTETQTPFDLERRVYLDGADLIIRESPERLVLIEDLLRNQEFIEKVVADKLRIATFSLIPRDAVEEQPEVMQSFANRVQEQVMTFLYAETGMQQAAMEGRKLWYDPNTLTLVMTDSPENIQHVKNFLGSLPELKTEEQFKIINLKHSLAENVAGELRTLLGLSGVDPTTADSGLTITKTLRQEQEFEWRDLNILVRRVNASGDPTTTIDDDAELVLRVRGSRQSTTQTVREKDVPVYISDAVGGEYEIYADDIRPSGTVGKGRVKLQITYNPPGTVGGGFAGGGF